LTSLFQITRDPFLGWKHTERVLREARGRGLETVVAMDDRTSKPDHDRLASLADLVIPWTSPGHCEPAYEFVQRCSSEFVLMIADDEEPSPLLWEFSLKVPFTARFGFPVIPIVGDKMYRPDIGIQERLIPREGWRWTGGFEGKSESPYPQVGINPNPGVIVWHYDLEAPREERESKARRYSTFSPGEHRSRLIYEEHPDGLVPIPSHLRAHLPARS
jgi:hypothetical protein